MSTSSLKNKKARISDIDVFKGDYYTWQTKTINIRGRNFITHAKPGMPGAQELDVAAALLAENINLQNSNSVLDLNCGTGLVGIVAASLVKGGQVWLADSNGVAFEAARKSVEANNLVNAQVYLSSGTSQLDLKTSVDLVTARLPKGKLPSLQLIWDAFEVLKPGGYFYLAGANEEGIKTYLRYAETLFGKINIVAYRKGHRVGLGIKEDRLLSTPEAFRHELLDHSKFHQFTIQIKGQAYPACSRPSVFSWNQLDEGTRILLETMEIGPAETVLDLGCGYGIVGLVAANLAPQGTVYMVDVDIEAVESSHRTTDLNGLTNCQVLLSDCASAVKHLSFDVVVTNPPFHLAKATVYETALQFIREAAAVLRPGGRFYLVANRFIPYEDLIEQSFGNVKAVYEDPRFKVLQANKALLT